MVSRFILGTIDESECSRMVESLRGERASYFIISDDTTARIGLSTANRSNIRRATLGRRRPGRCR